ncbi:MAG: peptide MFS transporter [Saprospiraceae bacterium]|nr:peptide MFS transporter [Saprospiraceae bacterium]
MANTTGHPRGLYVLFATEMWERFNYYGMRAILVLFTTQALLFSRQFSSELYGSYTGLIYLTPLIGGFLADRFWGNRQAIIFGGLVMALGEFVLFFCASWYKSDPDTASYLFYAGLALMIVGNGFFKPNISSMVGQLYPEGDRRKDSAYTIFYMGINMGAFLGPLVCGFVGNTGNPDDFKWAFLAAGTGMLISVITFQILKNKYIVSHEGVPVGMPSPEGQNSKFLFKSPTSIVTILGTLVFAGIVLGIIFVDVNQLGIVFPLLILSVIAIVWLIFSDKTLTKIEKDRIIVIFIVSFFVIFFWSAFEQAGASLTFFADEQTNRMIGSYEMPTAYFQSFNAAFIIIFAPVFAWIWLKLGQRNLEPHSPLKMAIGLFLLAIGYLVIAFGVKGVDPGIKVSMFWLTSLYLLHTWGELCLSPIGLSLVSKLAPLKLVSLLMAVWFLANAAANKLAGTLSGLYPPGEGEMRLAADNGVDLRGILNGAVQPTQDMLAKLNDLSIRADYPMLLGFQITNLYEFFMIFVVMAGIASGILFLLQSRLNKMMHGLR